MPADSYFTEDSYFVDTNVILYSLDVRSHAKRLAALAWLDHLWRKGSGRLSWQVLNEFYANAVRKMKVPTPEARDAVLIFTRWQPCTMSVAVVEQAWHWMDRAQLSYWDALVLASARRLGCRWLLSEDFQAGRDFDGITVVNPFTDRPPHEAPHPA